MNDKFTRFDVAAFRNWLVGIYDADPGGEAAAAVSTIVYSVFEQAEKLRDGLTSGDEYMQRALAGWDDDASAVADRFELYRTDLRDGDYKGPVGGILHGRWSLSSYVALTAGKRGLHQDGQHYTGMSDAAMVASLANQVFELVPEDAYLGGDTWFGETLRTALTYTASQMERAPAGEDPTVRDKLEVAAGESWDATKKAVGTAIAVAAGWLSWSVMVPVGIGVAAVGLGYVLVRKYV